MPLAAAARDANHQLVALGNAPGTGLGPLPRNMHVEAFVDQSAVLRHADLAVRHGGSGTMLGLTLAPDEITAGR